MSDGLRETAIAAFDDEYSEDKRGDAYEGPQPSTNGKAEPLGILLSTVRPEEVSWLWSGRIPLGKLTILDGDPGLGKSVLTMDLAARVSAGMTMPDGSPGAQGGVIVLNAEDGLADTILPRLLAAGGDPEKVLYLTFVKEGEEERIISFPRNLPEITTAIHQMGARLVIIDPLMAFLGDNYNAHKDQDCRRALHPLSNVAADTGAAVVVVRHLNKMAGSNPLYRGGGSIGIIGAARSGLLVAKDPDNPDRRVLASTKCNLARMPASLNFDLSPDGQGRLRIGWMGESAHTAESLLAVPKDDEERDAVQEAVNVLREILQSGPVASDDVKKEGRKAGVSDRTLMRAKQLLRVRSIKADFAAKWKWALPCQTP